MIKGKARIYLLVDLQGKKITFKVEGGGGQKKLVIFRAFFKKNISRKNCKTSKVNQ